MDVIVDVDKFGPLFDGRAEVALDDFREESVRTVAEQGYADIHYELDRVLRNPTPFYETQIQVERAVDSDWFVHDNGVIYGPWLEGTGSRNWPATSFPGYAHWRRTRQELQEKAPKIAAQILSRYIERMN